MLAVAAQAPPPPTFPLDVLIYAKQTEVGGTQLRARYPFGDRDMIMQGPFTPVSVSPDGRFLAFRHGTALHTTGLFFLPRDVSSSPRRSEWQLTAPITYRSSSRSWVGSRVLADRYDGRPAYSPDGSRLYYIKPERTSGEGDLMRISLNRSGWRVGEPVQMTNVGGAGRSGDTGAAVSPDGRTILINAYLGLAGISGKSLTSIGPDGGAKTRIPGVDGAFLTYIDWSPDGRKVAFALLQGEPDPSGVFVMNADGTGLTQIPGTADGDSHVVFGKGGEVYFSRREARYATDDARDIYMWRGSGSPVRHIGEVGAVEYPVASVRLTSIRRPG